MIYHQQLPRIAWAMLKRAMPYLHIEKFGQTYTLPTNSTQTAKFRRYFLQGATGAAGPDNGINGGSPFYIPLAITPLVEGVTPQGTILSNQDYTVQLQQYGDFVTITDVIEDTHTDPVLSQATEILGEQAAVTLETLRFNILVAGTNVWYANNVVGRGSIVTAIALADQRRVTTGLNRQNAKKITSVVASNPDFNTTSVEAAYMAIVHPDLDSDIRNMTGFVPVANTVLTRRHSREKSARLNSAGICRRLSSCPSPMPAVRTILVSSDRHREPIAMFIRFLLRPRCLWSRAAERQVQYDANGCESQTGSGLSAQRGRG